MPPQLRCSGLPGTRHVRGRSRLVRRRETNLDGASRIVAIMIRNSSALNFSTFTLLRKSFLDHRQTACVLLPLAHGGRPVR